MSFWPDDINEYDIRSPFEIMNDAGGELSSRASALDVLVSQTPLADRLVLAFEVRNRIADLSLRLFEVSHRLDQSYPVVIDPPSPDIPQFLRRQQYVAGKPGLAESIMMPTALNAMQSLQELRGSAGHYVENKWICSTPSEFRIKLKELFAQDHVKVRIISLISPTPVANANTGSKHDVSDAVQFEEPTEDET